jgi:hypothetical protein
MENQDYTPFGKEWKEEMGKHPKAFIVERLASVSKKLKETENLLLQATQNLGHPAYNHSSSTTIGIDNLREKCFDFLGVPKA